MLSSLSRKQLVLGIKIPFGIFFAKKRKLLARLQGIQNFVAYPTSIFLQNLEKTLTKDYNYILRIEDDYWNLRSHINWLNYEDVNTKYLHMSVLNRRHTNKISYFKDDQNNWIMNHGQIASHVFHYYQHFFSSEHLYTSCKSVYHTPRSFYHLDMSSLDRPLKNHEITTALFSFKPFKASGLNGIHLHFYQYH